MKKSWRMQSGKKPRAQTEIAPMANDTASQSTPWPPSLADLERERDELMRAIREDDDWHGRDHLPRGRWPMVHCIQEQINAMKARTHG